ncbi:cation-dependent mannose-6-phosphate receptor-like, partial [Brachionus plicatilis]
MKFLFFSIILFIFCYVECSQTKKDLPNQKNLIKEKLSDCKVKLDDESIIDLSSLNNPSNPMSTVDDTGENYFYYNPCGPIDCEFNSSNSAAVCMKKKNSELVNCGDQDSMNSSYFNSFYLIYQHNEITSRIRCECLDMQSFDFYSESPKGNYQFILKSKHCCPEKKSGLGFGSVILIIFVSVPFIYLIGGIVFLKFIKKKNGTEMIPNYQFWSSLPNYVRTGSAYAMSKISGNNSTYNE